VDELVDAVAQHKLTVHYILLTHAHVDHVSGVARARELFAAPVLLHEADQPLYAMAVEHGARFGLRVRQPPPVDRFYQPGEIIRFGRYEVRPHHTPGHCSGGVCLQVGPAGERGNWLFVGDTLFAGSIGRTDLPGGDFDTLINSITRVLFSFGDDAVVYPGHGPATTIGEERRTNPFLTGRG
jgi:glyoxylase-like metal-dependent hydrolase (beta-lactamase superfamily II)